MASALLKYVQPVPSVSDYASPVLIPVRLKTFKMKLAASLLAVIVCIEMHEEMIFTFEGP